MRDKNENVLGLWRTCPATCSRCRVLRGIQAEVVLASPLGADSLRPGTAPDFSASSTGLFPGRAHGDRTCSTFLTSAGGSTRSQTASRLPFAWHGEIIAGTRNGASEIVTLIFLPSSAFTTQQIGSCVTSDSAIDPSVSTTTLPRHAVVIQIS